jgi:hypothetical protein
VLRRDRPDAAVEAARQLRLDGPPLVRGELDGRILVGHPAEMIAGAMNVPAEVVELYEALFYDVRPRSIDDHWRAAGGAAVGYGVTEPEALIRWSGYKGLVASVAKYFRRGLDKEAELKESSDLAGEELELMRSCRRWVEVLALSAEDPVAVFAYMAGVKPLTWPVATRRSAARRPPCAERS